MKRVSGGVISALLISIVVGAAGCGLFQSPTTTTSTTTTTTSSTTTTTEPPPSWSRVEPTGARPSAHCYQAMVYASTSKKIYMFGGVQGTDSLKETWSYDAVANEWTKLEPWGEGQPSSGRQMPGAYDPTNLRIVSFDGTTWGYYVVENGWRDLEPGGDKLIPTRYGASMVQDEKSGKIILFGGADNSKSYDETWSYDAGSNTWTNLQPQGEVPAGRSDAGMVYDPAGGKIILFGGVDSEFECLDDTWSYDSAANTWTKVATSGAPAARSGVGLAYDRHSEQIILFGGIDSQLVCYKDTWAFDAVAGSWTELTPAGSPPFGRGRAALVYVPGIDKLVLFGGVTVQSDENGGFGSLVYLDDMWTYGVQLDSEDNAPAGASGTQETTTTTLAVEASQSTTTLE